MFQYEIEEDILDHVLRVRVLAIPPVPNAPPFEMTFEPVDDHTIRQVGIFHHGVPQHRAMGIPDAVLPAVANALSKRIISSPLQAAETGTYRTVDAEKMWSRLRGKGIALMDEAAGEYFIEPHLYYGKS
jgi:hypothetical protein